MSQARADRIQGKTGLTTAEREELARLRKEVRILAEDSLWSAYKTTVYRATVDGEDISIRPGQTHPSLDRALQARGVTNWAYITAWNPGSHELSRHENDERHERLGNDLARLGCEAFEGQGEPADSGWKPERAFSCSAFARLKLSILAAGMDRTRLSLGQLALNPGC